MIDFVDLVDVVVEVEFGDVVFEFFCVGGVVVFEIVSDVELCCWNFVYDVCEGFDEVV